MRRRRSIKPLVIMLLAVMGTAWIVQYNLRPLAKTDIITGPLPKASSLAGTIVSASRVTAFSASQVQAVSRQNYGATTPTPKYGVTKTLVQYYSSDLDGKPVKVYARVYQPVGVKAAPILGFATGTVGIGDECAPSLEQPAKVNWANYESHMMTYAGQGYASVVTDYEGMRDPGRIHHYMVGALEGRAVLDSVRAMMALDGNDDRLDPTKVFLAGYSQGGHAAFWADQIAHDYAPNLTVKGVIGWGPVMDVTQTLTDVTHSANINWFGPYVMTSYQDYYDENYDTAAMLTPQYNAKLRSDVLAHCIDTNLSYWGHDPAKVYSPAFIAAMSTNQPGQFQRFFDRMRSNEAGNATSPSAKLINQGAKDNVVLTAQQPPALQRICTHSQGPGELHVYPEASHYTAMVQSLNDTLSWMQRLRDGQAVPNQCTSPQ